jgi:hypothetical protein
MFGAFASFRTRFHFVPNAFLSFQTRFLPFQTWFERVFYRSKRVFSRSKRDLNAFSRVSNSIWTRFLSLSKRNLNAFFIVPNVFPLLDECSFLHLLLVHRKPLEINKYTSQTSKFKFYSSISRSEKIDCFSTNIKTTWSKRIHGTEATGKKWHFD